MSDRTIAVTAWEALFRAQVSVMRYLNSEFPTGELSLNEYDVLFNLSRLPRPAHSNPRSDRAPPRHAAEHQPHGRSPRRPRSSSRRWTIRRMPGA